MADAASGRAFVKVDRYAAFDLMAALDLSLTADGKPNYRGDPYCKVCEDF